jgi:hypothetical protein
MIVLFKQKLKSLNNVQKMSFDTIWTYCCSIGMKPIEFLGSQFQEVYQKLVRGLLYKY